MQLLKGAALLDPLQFAYQDSLEADELDALFKDVAFVTADLLRDLKRQFGAYKTFCLAEKNDDQRRDDVPNVRLWWKAPRRTRRPSPRG